MPAKTRLRIGDIIKGARIKLNMTAEDLAVACNVSRSRIYQWEGDDFILAKNLPALSTALHLSIKKLQDANGERR